MIHFLYGADTYRIKIRLSHIRQEFLASQPELNLTHQSANNLTSAQLSPLLTAVTLLGGDRLVILEDIFSAPLATREALVVLFKSGLSEGIDLVITADDDFDKRQSLFKWLTKSAQVEQLMPLAGSELTRFVQELADQRQLVLSPILINQLVRLAGSDLWRIDNEIKKLAGYSQSHPITEVVISQLVSRDPQDDIFAIMEALALRQPARANQLFADLVQSGEDPLGILAVLTFQIRTLLRVSVLQAQHKSASAIVQLTGLHPYAVSRALAQANRFSPKWIAQVYQLLVKLDWRIKQGGVTPHDAMDWLLATLAGTPA